jgi:hypothetical protein
VAYRSLIDAAKNMEVALTSETLLMYQIRRCHISEHCNLHSELLIAVCSSPSSRLCSNVTFLVTVFINETPFFEFGFLKIEGKTFPLQVLKT